MPSVTFRPGALRNLGVLPSYVLADVLIGDGAVADESDATGVQTGVLQNHAIYPDAEYGRHLYNWDCGLLDIPAAPLTKNRQITLTSRYQIDVNDFTTANESDDQNPLVQWNLVTNDPDDGSYLAGIQFGWENLTFDAYPPGPVQEFVSESEPVAGAAWEVLRLGFVSEDDVAFPLFEAVSATTNLGGDHAPNGSRFYVNLYEIEATLSWDWARTKAPPCRITGRADNLGIGSGRIWPPPNTHQSSNRRGGGSTY